MKFGDINDEGRRRLTGTTNKDWALSEVYKFVKQKTVLPKSPGEEPLGDSP
jgi:hypothetical protein